MKVITTFFPFLLLLLVGNINNNPHDVFVLAAHGGAEYHTKKGHRIIAGIKEGFRWIITPSLASKKQQKQKRTATSIKIARVGFGRTGTTSLEAALQILGYTPLRDDVLWEVSDLLGAYFRRNNEDRKDSQSSSSSLTMPDLIDQLGQRGFDAIFLYTEDFLQWAATEAPDNVKVILTVRDNAQVWAKSWLTVADLCRLLLYPPFLWLPRAKDIQPFLLATEQMHTNHAHPNLYKDIPTLEAAYLDHIEKVQRIVPPEKLLVFNVKEGWEPLCNFLGKPVPNLPFPHINDGVVVSAISATLWGIVYLWPILLVVWLMSVFYTCRWILARMYPSSSGKQQKQKEA
jgi:hypothetical protein